MAVLESSLFFFSDSAIENSFYSLYSSVVLTLLLRDDAGNRESRVQCLVDGLPHPAQERTFLLVILRLFPSLSLSLSLSVSLVPRVCDLQRKCKKLRVRALIQYTHSQFRSRDGPVINKNEINDWFSRSLELIWASVYDYHPMSASKY